MTGCADLIEEESDGALMFDIGGGSSELAWLDFRGGRPRRQGRMSASIRSWQSLPVGVVSIAERFGGVDVTAETFEAMVAYVASHLREFRGRGKLKQMIAEHPVHLIGTSGTVTTLAGLHLGLERYERQKVDGLWMTKAEVDATMKALLAMPFDRRVAHPCIGRDRADLVLPGCAIFEAIRREWPTERVRVADRGLREGILISLIDAGPRPGAADRWRGADGQDDEHGRRHGPQIRPRPQGAGEDQQGPQDRLDAVAAAAAQRPLCGQGQGRGAALARGVQADRAQRALQAAAQGHARGRSRRGAGRLEPSSRRRSSGRPRTIR